jgi:hypothetical protein
MVNPNKGQMKPFIGNQPALSIKLDIGQPMPLSELGVFLQDLGAIFTIVAEEYFIFENKPAGLSAELYVKKLSGGSLELTVDFFSNGVVQGVMANGLSALALYIFSRLFSKGKDKPSTPVSPRNVDAEIARKVSESADEQLTRVSVTAEVNRMKMSISIDGKTTNLTRN